MTFDHLSLFATGLMPVPWWGHVAVALALTHVTIAAVTIYLHRGQAHHGVELLQAWCHRAETSNIVALQKFSRRLRSFA